MWIYKCERTYCPPPSPTPFLQAELHTARGTAGAVVSATASERADLERRLAQAEARAAELAAAQVRGGGGWPRLRHALLRWQPHK